MESGRSTPSRDLLLTVSEKLDIPLRERNVLLLASGFPPVYEEPSWDSEIAPEWDVCCASIMRPAAQERIKKLMEQGFHKSGDVENRLGYHVGQIGR